MPTIPIPQFIKDELKKHVLGKCPNAEAGWENAQEDEDVITGDFFGNLRTPKTTTRNFNWRFSYDKLRGRGPGALEKPTGSDGIITITYTDIGSGKTYYKSLIFQAKKIDGTIDPEQIRKMRSHFPNANIILTYGPNGYFSTDENNNEQRICDLIINDFLNCNIGVFDVYYNRNTKKFVDETGVLKNTIKHLVNIDIEKVWE